MALDFPSSPTNGQVYQNYYYDGPTGAWRSLSSTVNPIPSTLKNLTISSTETTGVSLKVTPFTTSSVNLQEWYNTSSNVVASINVAGDLSANSLTLNTKLSVANGGTGANVFLDNVYLKGNGVLPITGQSGVPSSDITGTMLVSQGGTGATNASTALSNLGGAPITGADFTGSISSSGAITSTAGPAGIVLKAGPTLDHAYMTFYADSQAQSTRSGWFGYGTINSPNMTLSNEMTNGNLSFLVNGTGQVNLPTKTYMPGAVVQVSEVRAAAGDKSASSSAVDIISTTFTTKLASSKLLLMWHSGQVSMSGPQVNMMIYFTIDGSDISDFTTNHYFYGDNNTATFRHVVTIPVMSGALSMGAHTIKVRGQAYNGTATYDFQSNSSPERRSRLVIMEVAQ